MEQVLLGLVRVLPHRCGDRLGALACVGDVGFDANKPLQGMQPSSGLAPLVFAVPGEPVPQRVGGAPPVCVAEARQESPRAGEPQRANEFTPQNAERELAITARMPVTLCDASMSARGPPRSVRTQPG
mgnify:CR=1 FL=1